MIFFVVYVVFFSGRGGFFFLSGCFASVAVAPGRQLFLQNLLSRRRAKRNALVYKSFNMLHFAYTMGNKGGIT